MKCVIIFIIHLHLFPILLNGGENAVIFEEPILPVLVLYLCESLCCDIYAFVFFSFLFRFVLFPLIFFTVDFHHFHMRI